MLNSSENLMALFELTAEYFKAKRKEEGGSSRCHVLQSNEDMVIKMVAESDKLYSDMSVRSKFSWHQLLYEAVELI